LAVLMLEKAGHQIDVVEDGAAAIEAVNATDYDLVLMDVQMPVMDGLEAARRIRAAETDETRRTRVLALTANAFAEDREAALTAGMDGLLVKPLDPERLRQAVAAVAGSGADPLAA
jgi:CheY-like chemotaxis protein